MAVKMRLRETSSLAGGVLAAMLVTAPAVAQTTPEPVAGEEQATQVEQIVVTGSRIPRNEFTSASPVQVLTSARARRRAA